MQLACSRRCGGGLFRALFAELEVDASGEYQDHRVVQPGYVCLNCGAPAFDLGVVPEEVEAEAEDEEEWVAVVTDIHCAECEQMGRVGGEVECPNCGSPLEVD